MNIQVTNLNLGLIDSDLRRIFTPFGEVRSVKIMRDSHNNRSRGKAFVDMPVEKEAFNAMKHLQGFVLSGKSISLEEVAYVNDGETILIKPLL